MLFEELALVDCSGEGSNLASSYRAEIHQIKIIPLTSIDWRHIDSGDLIFSRFKRIRAWALEE
jgi:hypothetical protein